MTREAIETNGDWTRASVVKDPRKEQVMVKCVSSGFLTLVFLGLLAIGIGRTGAITAAQAPPLPPECRENATIITPFHETIRLKLGTQSV